MQGVGCLTLCLNFLHGIKMVGGGEEYIYIYIYISSFFNLSILVQVFTVAVPMLFHCFLYRAHVSLLQESIRTVKALHNIKEQICIGTAVITRLYLQLYT